MLPRTPPACFRIAALVRAFRCLHCSRVCRSTDLPTSTFNNSAQALHHLHILCWPSFIPRKLLLSWDGASIRMHSLEQKIAGSRL